ncbi:MAG: TolC family protein [bacterium]|nr:TolC family protein [bacterium]
MLTPLLAAVTVTLSLNQAIARGLEQNLDYRVAQEAITAAAAQLKQARAPELPFLSVGDTYQNTNPIVRITIPPLAPGARPLTLSEGLENVNNPNASIRFTLFDSGKTESQVGEAAASLAVAESQARESAGATVRTVSDDYYQLLQAQRLAAVADQALTVDQAHVKQAQQLLDAGTVARTDVLRAQTTLSNDQVAAIQAHNQVALAESSLDNALNYPVDTSLVLTDSIAATAPAISIETLRAAARANRGELLAARFAIDAAQAAVGVARSSGLPSINLQASEGNAQPALRSGFHAQFVLQLQAVWTLFDHGLTAGAVQRAESEVRRANLAYRQAQQGVDLQVKQAYLNLQAAQQGVVAAQHAVTYAEDNRRLDEERYSAGVGTALELADAQLQATTAEQNLVKALAEQQTALVNARFSAGLLGR